MSPRIAHVTTVDVTLRFLLMGQLRALRDAGHEVVGISAPGAWVADLEREGVRHLPWQNATRSWDPAADVKAFVELLGIFRRERFDLVHTHNPKPGVIGRIAARVAGVPCVVNTVHGLYAMPEDRVRKRWPVVSAEWIAARFSDLELYQSSEDLAWAVRLGVARPPKALLLGNGADLGRFDRSAVDPRRLRRLRSELGIGEDEIVVGTVGRMVAEKGYREFFAAAREIRLDAPGVRFVAVGGADPEKSDSLRPEELAAASDDVILTGWRDEDDVRDLLALMDVFVLPSWREGVPRSAIEAAAMGRPLVLTAIRGCREVAREGVEGFLVPPRDPYRLAIAIRTLVRDSALRDRMGAAARLRAVDRFDERRVCGTVIAQTKKLLARRGPRELLTEEHVPTTPRAGGVASGDPRS